MIRRMKFVQESMSSREMIPIPGTCLYIYAFILCGDGKSLLFPPPHKRKVAVWLRETTFSPGFKRTLKTRRKGLGNKTISGVWSLYKVVSLITLTHSDACGDSK